MVYNKLISVAHGEGLFKHIDEGKHGGKIKLIIFDLDGVLVGTKTYTMRCTPNGTD